MRKSRKEVYRCKVCGWETERHGSIGGHISGHVKRGEIKLDSYRLLPSRPSRLHVEQDEQPETSPSPEAIAAELLRAVVDRINESTNYVSQLDSLKLQILDLEVSFRKERDEKERVLKAHNECVRQSNGRMPDMKSILAAMERSKR